VTNPGVATWGYVSWKRLPYSDADVPPNVFVVPGSDGPPNCQVHCPLASVAVVEIV